MDFHLLISSLLRRRIVYYSDFTPPREARAKMAREISQ
jgi:hypothetical protein